MSYRTEKHFFVVFSRDHFQEGYQYLVQAGLVGGKAVLLGWNGEDSDGFLQVRGLRVYSSTVRNSSPVMNCEGLSLCVHDGQDGAFVFIHASCFAGDGISLKG